MSDEVTVLDAIINYVELSDKELEEIHDSINKINLQGDPLEFFVKDLLCNSLSLTSKEDKKSVYSRYLSWQGTKNNPPDIIIEEAEALEVKKISSKTGQIQLNSSTPHQVLSNNNKRITNDCKNCEGENGWDKKELVYVIGSAPNGANELDFIWFVYGDCWTAKDEIYEKLSDTLSDKINEAVEELDYGELNIDTNEIGRINDADPLGRSRLRIRGMWLMDHPANFYSQYIDDYSEKIEESVPLFAVMRKEKFESFPIEKQEQITQKEEISVQEVEVTDSTDGDGRVKVLIIEAV